MSLTPVLSTNSDSSNWSQVNNMIRQLNNDQVTKVYKQANNVDAMIDGRLPNDLGYGTLFYDQNGIPLIYIAVVNGQPVLKVAPSGVDATTATDDQLLLNSSRNVFKIVTTGTVSISHSHGSVNSAVTTSVAHGQSGRPIVVAYANSLVAPGVPGSPSRQLPFLYPAVSGGNMVIGTFLYHSTTATNIEFTSWSANITTITADVKYYILQETAS